MELESSFDAIEQDLKHLVDYCPENMKKKDFLLTLDGLKSKNERYLKSNKQNIDFEEVIQYTNADGVGVLTEEAKKKIYKFINIFPEGEDKKWITNSIGLLILDARIGSRINEMDLDDLVNPEHADYRIKISIIGMKNYINRRFFYRLENPEKNDIFEDLPEEPEKVNIFITRKTELENGFKNTERKYF